MSSLGDEAMRVARAAAERAGITIVNVRDLAGEAAVSGLFDRVWGVNDHDVVPANLLRALTHAGNYLAAAYAGDRIVGAAFGFFASTEGELHLHSHMTGVDPTCQQAGIGYALKLHQRAWALDHGLDRIEWTFDPLLRRNGYFNLMKLGTVVTGYRDNFYGDMPDGINAGDESDRVVVSWELGSDRVVAALDGHPAEPDIDAMKAAGAAIALDIGDDGSPHTFDVAAPIILCRIPEDVVALRQRDAGLAAAWRHALRDTFGKRVLGGSRATALTRSGWYILEG